MDLIAPNGTVCATIYDSEEEKNIHLVVVVVFLPTIPRESRILTLLIFRYRLVLPSLSRSTESSMSAKLVKGHWSVRLRRLFASYLCICSCIVFLFSHSQLTCPVLRVDSRFSHFSSRRPVFSIALHDFHVFYVGKREEEGEEEDVVVDVDERKKKSVCVCVHECLLSSICTIVLARSYAQCVHIRFYR